MFLKEVSYARLFDQNTVPKNNITVKYYDNLK